MARGQTVYRHPPTHPADMIVETPEKRFVSDEQMQEWNKLRQETPNAIIGTASDETTTLSDVQPYTNARSLKILGETTEIGEGEKSPDNPYELQGVENPVVAVSGKNLFGEFEIGGISSTTGQNTYDNARIRTVGYIPIQPNTDYIISLDDSPPTMVIYFYDKDKNYINATAVSTAFATPENCYFLRARMSVTDPTVRLQLELGTTATEYEPFKGYDEYPITLPQPLYSLPNGVADEVDLVSGKGQSRIHVKVFDGTEHFDLYTDYPIEGYGKFICPGLPPNAKAFILSSHFIGDIAFDYANTVKRNSVSSTSIRTQAIFKTNVATTVEGFKVWLANQHANGTPVTILYALETPEPFTIDPTEIPLYSPTSVISTTEGSLEVKYNRDINKVIQELTSAIIALGGTIDV